MKRESIHAVIYALACVLGIASFNTSPLAQDAPSGESSEPVIMGSLDKEEIRGVVRRHLKQMRYCYERELAKNPDLEGMVRIKFVISPSGAVASAVVDSSTLGNGKAEVCMTKQVRRWMFPKPKGGGVVVVKYPFEFKISGGSSGKGKRQVNPKDVEALKALEALEKEDGNLQMSMGGLGMGGSGIRGGGMGHDGPGHSSDTAIVARVEFGKVSVKGEYDEKIIRRIRRLHRNEIRYCYDKELAKTPDLAGSLEVEFTIEGNGTVKSAAITSSTLSDSAVGECVTKKISRWVFPEPKDRNLIVVKMPYTFSSGEAGKKK